MIEIIYSIGKRSKDDGCVLSFFPRIYLGYDEWRRRKRKEKKKRIHEPFTKYIFPLNIEILRAFLELFDAGSANPVNFTAQVSMIAESTVYPFFSVPLGKRKFPGRGRGREGGKLVSIGRREKFPRTSLEYATYSHRGSRRGSIEPSRTDENNGETKSGKKFSDNGAGNRGTGPRRHVLAAAALEINFDLTMRIPGGGCRWIFDALRWAFDACRFLEEGESKWADPKVECARCNSIKFRGSWREWKCNLEMVFEWGKW